MSNIYVRPGVIEGFVGPMMSGKSGALLKRVDPLRWMNGKYSFIGFKPKVDDREKTCRSQIDFIDWIYVDENSPREILKYVSQEHDLVVLDEVQFFSKEIIKIILQLQRQRKNVLFAGLDLDFRGIPFGPMPGLISLANELTKYNAICTTCGNPAYYTQRLINGKPAHYNEPIVSIEGKGKKETYTARCFEHHEVPGRGS